MAFHYRDGWYFERLISGRVRIYHVAQAEYAYGQIENFDVVLEIDSDSWASIIASVCARDETGETFQQAVDFHNRRV